MIDLVIPAEKRLHKERHLHHCPIHSRNKCKHTNHAEMCESCMFQEDNEICQKTLRATGLDHHVFPCINCMIVYRNQYGGETLIDAMIDLEQAARLAHVAPDAKLDAREQTEAETNPEVAELKRATDQI